MDSRYRQNRDIPAPFPIVADDIARFIAEDSARRVESDTATATLHSSRRQRLGAPRIIIPDSGTSFRGPRWGACSSVYGPFIIRAPTHGHYQIGLAGRHGEIITKS